MSVVIACKKTTKEAFAERYGASWPALLGCFDLELTEVEEEHEEHYQAVEALRRAFVRRGIAPQLVTRRAYAAETFVGAALVVSVGGDGEMLDVARYIRGQQLVIGYRSSRSSAGQLLAPPTLTPDELARSFVERSFHVEAWTRILGTLRNGGPPVTDLALNEIFVGDLYSVGAARYTLRFGDQEERQRSSGIIVSSGAGSTGWYANVAVPEAGGCHLGTPFDRCSPELRFVVRDLIRGHGNVLAAGSLQPGVLFEIKSTMNSDGIVSFDCSKLNYESPRAYPFDRGARVEISAVPDSLRVMKPLDLLD